NLPVIVMQYHHHGRNQELLESLSDRLVFIKKPISAVRITELLLFLYEQPKVNENRKLLRRCDIKNEAEDENVNGDGRRVLIVEDNPVNQKLIRRLLEKKGYEITVANDGLEGIAAHESVRFDIVLMDMQMPRMDGLTATREIRQRELNSGTHVPIIALTANAMQGDREKCMQAGMDEYISKPIDTKELFRIISRFHDSK
ncbi:MAG: response regulator, partial [Calditrichaeota bacterium]|nr:response regulator [Calditrichota bacterium]